MERYSVKDRVRTLDFTGELLASSSSKIPGKPRWVEFTVYRIPHDEGDQFILSRVGYSVFYHDKDCSTVHRNRLSAVDAMTLSNEYRPCSYCSPSLLDPEGVFPETPRPRAWVCTKAVGVVALLMKEDDNGVEYLTNVTARLLADASEVDPDIKDAYENEALN